MRRLVRLGALTGTALLGLTAVPALSATYATPDGDQHPYVVLLTFFADGDDDGTDIDTVPVPDGDDEDTLPDDYPSEYTWRCTGTLLSPTLVLTAGHCTVGNEVAHVYVGYGSETVHPAMTVPVGTANGMPEFGFLTGTPHSAPGYDDAWPEFPQTHDVGVVVLDEAIDPLAYGITEFPELLEVGGLDDYTQRQLKHDVVFETVGYGLQWTRGPWRYDGSWVRHRAWSTWVNATSANTTDRDGQYSFQTSNNKGHTEGGSCFGDSGGPVFIDDRADIGHTDGADHVIAGVVSFGMSPNCTGVDFSYRVDQAAVQEWVLSHHTAG